MTLKPCRSCGKQVSFDAKACPHCGAPNPASRSSITGCAKLALLAVGAVVALGALGHLMTPPKPKLTPEQVKAQEEACRQSAQCTGRRFKGAAEAPCAHAVEALAKFDYKWTNGFGERKFTRYDWANKEAGLLLYQGDSIQFQNGFGAFQRHVYECVYDPGNKRVVTVEARPWAL